MNQVAAAYLQERGYAIYLSFDAPRNCMECREIIPQGQYYAEDAVCAGLPHHIRCAARIERAKDRAANLPKKAERPMTTATPITFPTYPVQPLDLANIVPSTLNPRKNFDPEALEQLAQSIRAVGILEPLIVRPYPGGTGAGAGPQFELIAGERRFRAAILAGLTHVPAYIRSDLDETAVRRVALIENLQRSDLTPVEEARAFRQLVDTGMKQNELAETIGRSPSVISNAIRLLELPDEVLDRVNAGTLSPAHARALVKFAKVPVLVARIAEHIAESGTTAKELEREIARNDNGIPFQWQLYSGANAGLRSLQNYRAAFDVTVCDPCPFNARFGDHCARPEHYDELQSATLAEQAVTRAAEFAAEEAKLAAEAPADGKPVKDAGRRVPMANLHYGDYEHIDGKRPAGCNAACPCVATGVREGGHTERICLDPKRLSKLRNAEARVERKAKKEEVSARKVQLQKWLDDLPELGVRELAVIAHKAVSALGYGQDTTRALTDAAAHRFGESQAKGWAEAAIKRIALGQTPGQALDPAGLGRESVLKAVLEAIAIRELDLSIEYGGTEITDYLLGKAPPEPAGKPLVEVMPL